MEEAKFEFGLLMSNDNIMMAVSGMCDGHWQ